MDFSKKRYAGLAKLGPKSQIVIPKEVRQLFGLKPGDTLLLLADVERGIALVDPADYEELFHDVFPQKKKGG